MTYFIFGALFASARMLYVVSVEDAVMCICACDIVRAKAVHGANPARS